MRIAVATNDEKTKSTLFGHTTNCAVNIFEDDQITARRLRDIVGHREFQLKGMQGRYLLQENPYL